MSTSVTVHVAPPGTTKLSAASADNVELSVRLAETMPLPRSLSYWS